MSENTGNNVIEVDDFSDLGNPVVFKFQGQKYCVPYIPNKKARILIKMAREARNKASELEKKVKALEEQGGADFFEETDEMDNIFGFHISFITSAHLSFMDDSGNLVPVSEEYIDENWPTSLVLKVFTLVNDAIMKQEKKQ